ncbi:haloacid dehalogenase type II [Beijerinckia sp. L45]|uniref:haloacid dehalogenase type II n=1 Tax=Beijerinckia sp. L45 TaxID=1641855 RepID=UPI00131D0BAA|nr:haloacid dehalogenase type II [Beijerinckia sp. L45]
MTTQFQVDRSGREWIGGEPKVLVFDVNETMLDFEVMSPLFERMFGDERVLREWFGQLIMYSMTITHAGLYADFFALGQGCLRMLGDIHAVEISDADVDEIGRTMATMPAHPEVLEGLERLKDAGFRLMTLTNSSPRSGKTSPLENAGVAHLIEQQYYVQQARAYKPAPVVYQMVAQELGVPASSCCMVAAHVWDTVGAQAQGFSGALVKRRGNAPLPVKGLPQPHIVTPDFQALADELISRWR